MQYYKCYSARLKNFLKTNGKNYINKGHNKQTDRPFWVFELDEELSELLTIYSNQYK